MCQMCDVHTEHSHASFVPDRMSEEVKILSTIASCKNIKCFFLVVKFFEGNNLKDHTQHSHAICSV